MSEDESEDEFQESISDTSLLSFEEKVLEPTPHSKKNKKKSNMADTNSKTPRTHASQSDEDDENNPQELLKEMIRLFVRRKSGDVDKARRLGELLAEKVKTLKTAMKLADEDPGGSGETKSPCSNEEYENMKAKEKQLQEKIENYEAKLAEKEDKSETLNSERVNFVERIRLLEDENERLRQGMLKRDRTTPEKIRACIDQQLQTLEITITNGDTEASKESIYNIRREVGRLMSHIEEIEESRDKYKMDLIKAHEVIRTTETIDQLKTEIQRSIDTRLGQHSTTLRRTVEDIKREVESIKRNTKASVPLQNHRPQMGTSYSEKLQQRQPKKPSLVVQPKDANISINEMKAALNREIDTATILKLQCKQTKAGNLVLTLNTEADATELKNRLQSNENLTTKMDITNAKPRMTKVIIFGAPSFTHEEGEIDKENYKEQRLDPALQQSLRLEKVDSTLHRIIKTNRKDSVNLVVEVSQRDASYLEQNKINIGFNRCSVRRYVVTPRCYNCQRIGHMSKDCPNEETCAKCARPHNTASCSMDRKRCVNCFDAERDRTSGKSINFEHFAYEGCCTTYRAYQRELLDKQRQMASRSG